MKNKNGYASLVIVLTLSVVVLAIASTVALLSIGEAQSSYALSKGETTLQFVDGCMEDALLKSKNSAGYAGGNITRPEGTCIINISKNGNNWTVNATTSDTTYKRTMQAQIVRQTTGSITILSWKEI